MKLSETDLELLSAYHDGELDAVEARAMDARIRDEPELRAALDGIREVSRAMAGLKPQPAALPRPTPGPARHPWMKIAAGLAAVAVLAAGILWLTPTGAPTSPVTWHHHFAAKSYGKANETTAKPVTKWISTEPDLSAANLRLVDVAGSEDDAVYLHYSGRNGCRLTFGAHASAPALPAATGGLLVHGWNIGRTHYSVIADGMDRGKFAAITALLKEHTRDHETVAETVVALREATGAALPCA